MIDMAVNASIGEESHEVNSASFFCSCLKGVEKGCILIQSFIFDCVIDANKVLVNDSTRSHSHMTHFGVSHHSVGKAYCSTMGEDLGARVLCPKFFIKRHLGVGDGIVRGVFSDSKAIENDEQSSTVHRI